MSGEPQSKALDSNRVVKLAEKYGASLVLFARQWTREPDDALQEALIVLLNVAQPPIDAVAWLFTAVKRKAMNHIRSETRRRKYTQSFAANRDVWFDDDQSKSLLAQKVQSLLETLPELDRQILVARIWGELSFQQIAEVVDRSRRPRVLDRWRRILVDTGGRCEFSLARPTTLHSIRRRRHLAKSTAE